jgi:hypothetical protein
MLFPRIKGTSGSQPGTSTPKALGEGCTWQALIKKQRPSQAICRMDDCQLSRESTVGAHHISTPLAYMAMRKSGM